MLFTLIAILCFCSQSVVGIGGTTSVEHYIRNYFEAHPTDSGAAAVTLPDGKQWPSGSHQVKIIKIPIPRVQENAYIIPIELNDEKGTKFIVKMLFYAPEEQDDIDGGTPYSEHVRTWKLEVGPKGHLGSFITIREHYDTRFGKKYIKPIKGKIDWSYHDLDADIRPLPQDTINFLGCFWFQLFGEFNLGSAITTDGANIEVATIGMVEHALLMFIRAFVGKTSIYVKEKKYFGFKTVSTFKPNPGAPEDEEPWKSLSYLELIKIIKEYKMKNIQHELNDRDWTTIVNIARVTRWDTDGSFAKPAEGTTNFMEKKDEIGSFMEFLWFGEGGSVVGKDADERNHMRWITVFTILSERTIIFRKILEMLGSRYTDMKMEKPVIGWSNMCYDQSFKHYKITPIVEASRTASSSSLSFDPLPVMDAADTKPLSAAVHHDEPRYSYSLHRTSSESAVSAHSLMSERYNYSPYFPYHHDDVVMMFLVLDGVLFCLLSCLCVLVCLAIYCVFQRFNNKEDVDPCFIIDNLV